MPGLHLMNDGAASPQQQQQEQQIVMKVPAAPPAANEPCLHWSDQNNKSCQKELPAGGSDETLPQHTCKTLWRIPRQGQQSAWLLGQPGAGSGSNSFHQAGTTCSAFLALSLLLVRPAARQRRYCRRCTNTKGLGCLWVCVFAGGV